jgi:hypothetical protein
MNMDIKKAASVKMATPKWGFAIYTQDYKGNPCQPTIYLLEKHTKKDIFIQVGGWYASSLLERVPSCSDPHDSEKVGLYIDFGQDWYIPAGPYKIVCDYIKEFLDKSICYHDSEVLNGEVW